MNVFISYQQKPFLCILKRPSTAGGSTEIFTSKAIDIIAKESAGIPRMVNRICEKSLMYAYQQQHKLIDDYAVAFIVENEIAN